MLPFIQTSAKRQRSPSYHNPRHHSKELLSDVALKKARKDAHSPFLPFLSDGSLTFFTNRNSNKNRRERQNIKSGMSKIKQRGGGFRDHTSKMSTDKSRGKYNSSCGVKTQDLQLRFQSAMNVNKGWSIQNPNPRLQKLQGDAGKFNTGLAPFSFRNIDDYSLLKRTLAAPHVEYLYRHKHSNLIEERQMKTSGSTAPLNDRFSIVASTAPEVRPHRLPEISPPPIRPLAQLSNASSPLIKNDELVCVHKKSCGCAHNNERERVPSRSMYNRWERKPTSVQHTKCLKSNNSSGMVGSKVRVKPINEKQLVSPPRISQKILNRETSLENLRRKAKKAFKPNTNSQDGIDNRRHSLQNPVAKSFSSKKINNGDEHKPTSTSGTRSPRGLVTNEDKDNQEGQITNDDNSKDVSTDLEPDLIIVFPSEESPDDQMIDALTVVDTVSSVVSPTSTRRVATPRILKMNYTDDESNIDKMSALRKTFKRLDTDGDGHLTFDELKQGLPSGLTKRQLDYLKEIYLMACESTFFGFEEFAAVNQMCDVIVNVSPCVLEAYESIDMSNIEDKLKMYMELSTYLDRKQSGSLDNSSFKELLSSTMNLQQNNELINTILLTLNKEASDDFISSVELLVFIPYLIFLTPR